MPARRPYASRGVPRRATTRQSGTAISAGGVAALVGVVVVIALGVVWLGDLWPRSSQTTSSTPSASAANSVGGGSAASAGAGAAGGAQAASGSVLQMANIATPAPAGRTDVVASPQPGSTPTATLRRWDTGSPGLVSDSALAARLDQALVGVDGRVSVAVKDLGSGRGAVLDGDRELPAASLYKLPVLDTVFEVGLGMGEELPITEEARSYDTGSMELGVGEKLTVAEALERMITLSDNTSAVMLARTLR